MTDDSAAKDFRKKLDALRGKREDIILKNHELLKVQRKETALIKNELKKRPCTVPELASQTGIASEKVFYYISALKKFGEIEEKREGNGYFLYYLKDDKKKSSVDGDPGFRE